jgi:hypothetical protein
MNRRIRFFACAAAFLALAPPPLLLARETAQIAPGRWVRVTIDLDRAGEDFATGARGTPSKSLPDDCRPVRAARPRVTLEGALQNMDEKTPMLWVPRENRSLVRRRAAVTVLDARVHPSQRAPGLCLGIALGGAKGCAVGAATTGNARSDGSDPFPRLCGSAWDAPAKLANVILGAFGGGILGLFVAPGAKWEQNVPLDRAHASLAPTGVSFALAF